MLLSTIKYQSTPSTVLGPKLAPTAAIRVAEPIGSRNVPKAKFPALRSQGPIRSQNWTISTPQVRARRTQDGSASSRTIRLDGTTGEYGQTGGPAQIKCSVLSPGYALKTPKGGYHYPSRRTHGDISSHADVRSPTVFEGSGTGSGSIEAAVYSPKSDDRPRYRSANHDGGPPFNDAQRAHRPPASGGAVLWKMLRWACARRY